MPTTYHAPNHPLERLGSKAGSYAQSEHGAASSPGPWASLTSPWRLRVGALLPPPAHPDTDSGPGDQAPGKAHLLRSAVSGEFLGLSEPRVNEISALWLLKLHDRRCVTCRAPVTRRLLLAPWLRSPNRSHPAAVSSRPVLNPGLRGSAPALTHRRVPGTLRPRRPSSYTGTCVPSSPAESQIAILAPIIPHLSGLLRHRVLSEPVAGSVDLGHSGHGPSLPQPTSPLDCLHLAKPLL